MELLHIQGLPFPEWGPIVESENRRLRAAGSNLRAHWNLDCDHLEYLRLEDGSVKVPHQRARPPLRSEWEAH